VFAVLFLFLTVNLGFFVGIVSFVALRPSPRAPVAAVVAHGLLHLEEDGFQRDGGVRGDALGDAELPGLLGGLDGANEQPTPLVDGAHDLPRHPVLDQPSLGGQVLRPPLPDQLAVPEVAPVLVGGRSPG
jgi:hypothetical protein